MCVCVTEDIDKLICLNRKDTNTTLNMRRRNSLANIIIYHISYYIIIVIMPGRIHPFPFRSTVCVD